MARTKQRARRSGNHKKQKPKLTHAEEQRKMVRDANRMLNDLPYLRGDNAALGKDEEEKDQPSSEESKTEEVEVKKDEKKEPADVDQAVKDISSL